MSWRFAITVLAGCGRLGFDEEQARPDAAVLGPRLSGLVAAYSLDDDPAARSYADDSGGGHSAVCLPTRCPTSIEGRFGKAAQFDGTTQFLAIADAPELHLTRAYTVAAWVRLDTLPGAGVAVGKTQGTLDLNSFNLFTLRNSGTCIEYVTQVDHQDVCDGVDSPIGRWFHLAEVWNGSAVVMYLDGISAAQHAFTDDILFDGNAVTIGADNDNQAISVFWPGAVDDVQIYNRALDVAELVELAR